MVVGAKVCELTDGFLWFVCGLYVGILTSPLSQLQKTQIICFRRHSMEKTKWFILQQCHILPYPVEQGLDMKHCMASLLFLCRFLEVFVRTPRLEVCPSLY